MEADVLDVPSECPIKIEASSAVLMALVLAPNGTSVLGDCTADAMKDRKVHGM